ncbi:MAG TPA: PilN domain-containing protein [Pyrinomonadaceae bacterium]|nr:PilN domain-containing protein [Pyrinomonadaceae bacterium]
MIKINLLESVTDRPAGVAFVEDRVSSTRTQTSLLALTVMALMVLGMGYDYVSANAQHEAATKELDKQKRINEQMMAVKREQSDLEKKIADINFRIDAIQKLRASQQGPGAVLSEIKARFDSVPGLYLKSVEQKDAELVIKGESPNEAAVTRFGQSMEFSSGLFTNLNIETQREIAATKGVNGASVAASQQDPNAPRPEVVAFTIKCSYARNAGQQNSNPSPVPANHVAKN